VIDLASIEKAHRRSIEVTRHIIGEPRSFDDGIQQRRVILELCRCLVTLAAGIRECGAHLVRATGLDLGLPGELTREQCCVIEAMEARHHPTRGGVDDDLRDALTAEVAGELAEADLLGATIVVR